MACVYTCTHVYHRDIYTGRGAEAQNKNPERLRNTKYSPVLRPSCGRGCHTEVTISGTKASPPFFCERMSGSHRSLLEGLRANPGMTKMVV